MSTILKAFGNLAIVGSITAFFKEVWERLAKNHENVFSKKSLALKFGAAALVCGGYAIYGVAFAGATLLAGLAYFAAGTLLLGSALTALHLVASVLRSSGSALAEYYTVAKTWIVSKFAKKTAGGSDDFSKFQTTANGEVLVTEPATASDVSPIKKKVRGKK